MTADDVVWEEPPPPFARRSLVFSEEVEKAMRANPFKWAVVKKGHTNSATPYNWAKTHPDFEVIVRASTTKRGRFDIWARYVGKDEPQYPEFKPDEK